MLNWESDALNASTGWFSGSGTTQTCSREDCLAAINGERVPPAALEQGQLALQLCVIRGIRYHYGFAAELRNAGTEHPEYIRALNARDIMSDIIPEIVKPREFPYCIWHPAIAAEQTYRALWQRYPILRYHVGRACAVAGYVQLFRELQLLPEVSIAEEARDNQHRNSGSREIYDLIMSTPSKWVVMDDYKRSVNLQDPRPVRFGLSGDTAVYSSLQFKRPIEELGESWAHDENLLRELKEASHPTPYFNITEDWSIGTNNFTPDKTPDNVNMATHLRNSDAMVALLWNPLPFDLPEGSKDILILMSAYHGNIDRYERLRRPGHPGQAEENCVVRGIYHSAMFAKWWSLQPNNEAYRRAINARFIMSNDISRITTDIPPYELPYLIWYPARASAATYLELARRRPEMKPAAARACIVAGYRQAWDELDVDPSYELFVEAKACADQYYLDDLRRRSAERGLEHVEAYKPGLDAPLHQYPQHKLVEGSSDRLLPFLPVNHTGFDPFSTGLYGLEVDAGDVQLFVCAPEELRPTADYSHLDIAQLYYEMGHPCDAEKPESRAYQTRARRGRVRPRAIAWGKRPPRNE
ncbi:hypothetical protein BX600DRAFT_463143 [Xylariales sp. PMI_506]|nr:hypothetical protein BX600DRAFT_463143 [Xylariales sp. PMI_506]